MTQQRVTGNPEEMAVGAARVQTVVRDVGQFGSAVGKAGGTAAGLVKAAGNPAAALACFDLDLAAVKAIQDIAQTCANLANTTLISSAMFHSVASSAIRSPSGLAGAARRAQNQFGTPAARPATATVSGPPFAVPTGDHTAIIVQGKQLRGLATQPDQLQIALHDALSSVLNDWQSHVSAKVRSCAEAAAAQLPRLCSPLHLWGQALIDYGNALATAQQVAKGFNTQDRNLSTSPAISSEYWLNRTLQSQQCASLQAKLSAADRKLTGACQAARQEINGIKTAFPGSPLDRSQKLLAAVFSSEESILLRQAESVAAVEDQEGRKTTIPENSEETPSGDKAIFKETLSGQLRTDEIMRQVDSRLRVLNQSLPGLPARDRSINGLWTHLDASFNEAGSSRDLVARNVYLREYNLGTSRVSKKLDNADRQLNDLLINAVNTNEHNPANYTPLFGQYSGLPSGHPYEPDPNEP